MHPGIFAKTFSRPTLEAVLDAVVEHGIEDIQFNMACAGLQSMPDDIDPAHADRIRQAAAERGLNIDAVSGTFNMIHPDTEVRRKGLKNLGVLAGASKKLGTSTITLSTGTRDPENLWRRHPDNTTREAWRDMLTSMQEALSIAEEHEVTLAFEPEINNVVDSAEKGRRLLDEMASDRLKVVMDAANLFDQDDPKRRLSRSGEILGKAFEALGEDIVLAHAKDIKTSGELVGAGRGDLDWDLYVEHLRSAGYDGPLIMHGLGEDEVEDSLVFLRKKLAAGADETRQRVAR